MANNNNEDLPISRNDVTKMLRGFYTKCADPEEKRSINLVEVLGLMEYMAKKVVGDEHFGKLFNMGLKIVAKLTPDPHENFLEFFIQISNLLCDLCATIDYQKQFVQEFLKRWLQLLENIPGDDKAQAFVSIGVEKFHKCCDFLVNIGCVSMQIQMMDILHSYLRGNDKYADWQRILFNKCIECPEDLSDYFKSIEMTDDNVSLDQKQMALHLINTGTENRTVVSELIIGVKIGKLIKEFNSKEVWLHMNKVSKSIEFWIPHQSATIKVTITANDVRNIQIKDTGMCMVDEVIFQLHSPPHFESDVETIPPGLQSTTVHVYFDLLLKRKLEPMLWTLFNIEAELIVDVPILEQSRDSDIEIIEAEERHESPLASARRPVLTDPSGDFILVPNVSSKPDPFKNRGKEANSRLGAKDDKSESSRKHSLLMHDSDDEEEARREELGSPITIPSRSFYGNKSNPVVVLDRSNDFDRLRDNEQFKKPTSFNRTVLSPIKVDSSPIKVDPSPIKVDPSPKKVYPPKNASSVPKKVEMLPRAPIPLPKKVDLQSNSFVSSSKKTKPPPKRAVPMPKRDTSPQNPEPNVTIRKRKPRASAQKAIGNIKKTLEEEKNSSIFIDSNDSNEDFSPKKRRTTGVRPKKMTTNTSVRYPTINFGKKVGPQPPRRLYPGVEMIDLDAIEELTEPKKRASVKTSNAPVDPELTPLSFKSSIYKDTRQIQSRIIDNMNKINQINNPNTTPGSHRSNVSFSYLKSAVKNASRHANETIVIEEDAPASPMPVDDQFDAASEANVDLNGNKECQCRKSVKNGLQSIAQTVNQVLSGLNECKCVCSCEKSPDQEMKD